MREGRAEEAILVEGARENNLKGIDLRIPHRCLTVLTGVSGSGKSSLAFDTLFAEGQRRYVESLSTYARQFLGQLERPSYDRIRGLSPTIAVGPASAGRGGPRSTVGTMTEIHDFLRVLFARLGVQYCPGCSRKVGRHDPDRIRREMAALPEGTRLVILAPLVRSRRGAHARALQQAFKDGFSRVRVDSEQRELGLDLDLDPEVPHDIELVVDRVVLRPGREARITDSLETALKAGQGELILAPEGEPERRYSENLRCDYCKITFPELSPASFSFNTPTGCCPECRGLGSVLSIDAERVVPDPSRSLREGAIQAPGFGRVGRAGHTHDGLASLAARCGIELERPFRELSEEHRRIILDGEGRTPEQEPDQSSSESVGRQHRIWEGVRPTLLRRLKETSSEAAARSYHSLLKDAICPTCRGTRLRAESAAVRVGHASLPEIESLPISELLETLERLDPSDADRLVADELLRELRARIGLLVELGLGYLSLDRPGPSLSGGEAQRLRLAGHLGGELTRVTYLLDEPSTGLHAVDADRLIRALHQLRDDGNTVIVVEHDEALIRSADHVIDFGPGAGEAGGRVVTCGSVEKLEACPESLTGAFLSGRRKVETRSGRRPLPDRWLVIRGCRGHNLQGIDLEIPLGRMVAVTGVSGSGKSTLISQTLYPALANRLHRARRQAQQFDEIEGIEQIDKVVRIDQGPIGRSPRSNAATYTGAFELIRELFATTREARAYGFGPRRFSFNVRDGRCEVCKGEGSRKVEMHFLPDLRVRCDACQGRRFNEATLRVRYRGLSIAEILDLSCADAAGLFAAHPDLSRILGTLRQVGLGYLRLGQPSSTLSGGEAQRVKLARELARKEHGRTLYLLDEPSRGLHPHDLLQLMQVLDGLVQRGNTVIIVEHNLDIVKQADRVIDLGPGAGRDGGRLVLAGTPEELAACPESLTGPYLARAMRGPAAELRIE